MFPECFQSVSRKFHKNVKGDPMKFVLCCMALIATTLADGGLDYIQCSILISIPVNSKSKVSMGGGQPCCCREYMCMQG